MQPAYYRNHAVAEYYKLRLLDPLAFASFLCVRSSLQIFHLYVLGAVDMWLVVAGMVCTCKPVGCHGPMTKSTGGSIGIGRARRQ